MIKVYIIDDHQIIIDGIVNHLADHSNISVIGSNTNPVEAIESLKLLNPDVIITDISMPTMNGIACAQNILKSDPSAKIIFLSTHLETSIIKKAIKSGGKGYVSKATGIATLDEAIVKVNNGDIYLATEISQALVSELTHSSKKPSSYSVIPRLTKREKEILELIASEATTDEISKQLFISKNTVETHRKNLISKFQVRNSVGLVKAAMELDILG